MAPWRSSLPTVTGAPGSVRGLLNKATHTGHLGIRAHPTHARCCRRGIAVTSIRLWVALLQPRRGPTQALRARCALQLPGDQPPLLEFLALLRLSHQKARAATRAIHFCDRAATRKTKSCATGQRVRQQTAPSGHAQDKPWNGAKGIALTKQNARVPRATIAGVRPGGWRTALRKHLISHACMCPKIAPDRGRAHIS